jgi:muramidase (phage lysozyme)
MTPKGTQVAALAVVGLVAYRAWVAYQDTYGSTSTGAAGSSEGWLSQAGDVLASTANTIDSWSGGILKISAMAKVDKSLLSLANVRATLALIRAGEGTVGEAGYHRIFGGGAFESLADHPRITVKRSGYTSTAAGAYQALVGTWDETAAIMGLKDFGQWSQDMFAVGRIAARGALPDVIAGRITAAIRKINKEWASMPESPYGQPVLTMAKALEIYTANGGKVTA